MIASDVETGAAGATTVLFTFTITLVGVVRLEAKVDAKRLFGRDRDRDLLARVEPKTSNIARLESVISWLK